MLRLFAYFIALILELLFAISFIVYTLSLMYSSIKGAPFVPTRVKEAEFVLREANLKKNSIFYDLGCGDGRIVRIAAQKFAVRGIGIDVNPLLIWYARLLSRIQKINCLEFIQQNILESNISGADVVYLFLMPKLVKTFRKKLDTDLKKETLVISHGFSIEGWEKKLFKKISHKPYPTYFYRV